MNSEQFKQSLGCAFKTQRNRLKLTHEDISERTNINVNYYARIERGEINTSLEKILAIASALEAKPSELFSMAETTTAE